MTGNRRKANSDDLGKQIAVALEGLFESVALTRQQHFTDNPTKRPSAEDITSIVKSYSNQNAIITGSANLVPGPWGMLITVPELTVVIRNQIQMVYDIGVANGKEAHLDATLLLGIFSTVMGGGTISLVTVRGSQLLVKKASVRVIQKIIFALGGKISQKLLKRFIAKWLPLAGAAAMAVWARQSTVKMGEKAAEMLAMDIVDSQEEISEDDISS